MQLHRAMSYNPRADFVVETVQMISGLLLVLFLWVHMIFVGTVIIGKTTFGSLASFMETWGTGTEVGKVLSPLYLTIIFLILVFGMHVGTVMRRMPRQYREQKIVWQHAKLIHHYDTWSWVFQSITGTAILVLAAIHITVVTGFGISPALSGTRMHYWGFLIFYAVLLLLSEYHASVGLYRIFVKWGYVQHHKMKHVLEVISLLFIIIGIISIVILFTWGAH
ncbi:hypothetical protein [Alicyclobacillus sp. SO9]|uniref:hypothetical protein n=1 Tax=Alicyclobacillus sp. SO9 TaxID=2665646 RepID=UPI0018E9050A|nr:hypothetical protein [Alicyclobacillus sp. SO9]QQE80140.1 hypothetical protein GI364_06820 [Alicyclobacillus sp. SO9]